MSVPFFANDPSVLFDKYYVTELFPTTDMTYEQKMNAVARLVILLSLIGFLVTMKPRFLIIGMATLVLIFMLRRRSNLEGLTNSTDKGKTDKGKSKSEFKIGTKKNPMSNVLLTHIADEPDRKPAPPAYMNEETITKNTKKSVQFMNPEIKNTSKQLYGELWEKFELDQSNRAFFSTANTQVAADQGAFSQFLYGDMISGKENNANGAIARTQDNARYRLY
jgi:hypothetical protein